MTQTSKRGTGECEMREEFEQYRAMGGRIKRLRKQLREMECATDTVRGSSAEFPYTAHAITVSGRNAAEEMAIGAEIAQLTLRRERVERVLKAETDEELKWMMELKYLDEVKRGWEEVAAVMGETVSGEALRKRAEKFFDRVSGIS